MDEQKTRDALDVLGDLYLTGQGSDADHRRSPVAVMPPSLPGEGTTSQGGPTMRLAPADLPKAGSMPGSLQAEVVLLGNLPVLARPWLSQYARTIAEDHGSVAVAHIDVEDLDLELVAPAGSGLDQSSLASPCDGPTPRLTESVQNFSRLGRLRPRRCLLHIDLSQIDALPSWVTGVERWTVLTGADEAAVQASAKVVRDLLATVGDEWLPNIGVAFAGCGAEEAVTATEKINALVASSENVPPEVTVECRQTAPRMAPLRQEIIGTFPFDQPNRRALGLLLGAPFRRGPHATDGDQPVPGPTSRDAVHAAAPEHGGPSVETGGVAGTIYHEGTVATAPPAGSENIAHREAVVSCDAPSSDEVPPPPSRVAGRDVMPDLVGFGGERLEGAVRLAARCPYDPDVALALDPEGRLHLLLHVAGADPAPALARLVSLRQWTAEHLPVLRLTERTRDFNDTAAPVAHLFTDQPRLGAELATRCGDAMCVHLLARVGSDAEGNWYSAELN